MSILLGNIKIKELQERLGIKLDAEALNFFESNYQSNANTKQFKNNEWHCFDIPFCIVASNYETAKRINDILSPYAKDMKEQIQIAIA